MNIKPTNWEAEQKRVEGTIGTLLRTGVIIAALVVAAGGVFYLARNGWALPSLHEFKSEPQELRSIIGIVRYARSAHSLGLIQVGILLLIATPISRVIFTVFAFVEERDWMYVGITLIVTALLLYSLLARH